jgi:hypothetical protein
MRDICQVTQKRAEDMLRLQEIGEKDGKYATSNYEKVKTCPLVEIHSQ